MNKIAKCRCCGSDGEIEEFMIVIFAVCCAAFECRVVGPSRKTPEEAVQAWNDLMEPGKT
jgi:hypothetical protein